LGQTLTTEIGKTGSYAAAQTHNQVRDDLAAADRRRVASAFNRLAAVFTLYNYGPGIEPPAFVFAEDEDLQDDRAERDTKLFALGFRPKKSYIAREYGIPEDDFDLVNPGEPQAAFSRAPSALIPESEHLEDCGCQDGTAPPLPVASGSQEKKKPGGLFGLLPRLFADKEDRAREKDDRLTGDFETALLKKGQEETDATIDRLLDAAAKAATFEDAFEILASAYGSLSAVELAQIIDNLRYAGSQIGAARG
jgi:phage gp29-like protein